MLLTILLSLIFIAAVFVLLLAAVVLIQDKRFFTTAPKDIQAVAIDHPERFPGAHLLGWIVAFLCFVLMIGVFVNGGWNGVKNSFTFWQHWLRFAAILYLWKAFDIVCLDWFLLTKSHFFQRFYPETEGCEGYNQFGFNRKGQLIRLAVFPFVSALMAWTAMWIRGQL